MKKTMIALIAVIAMMAYTAPVATAQEWTDAEKEVWQVVEDNWAAWAEGNLDALMAGMHDGYLGWNTGDPLPVCKMRSEKQYKKAFEKMTVIDYDLIPARISVEDDAAVAHYFWSATLKYGEDNVVKVSGRYVEFYVKDGKKWLLLGDFTSFNDDEED